MQANSHTTQTLRVKICGLTRREDAALACELGADALGFIFYRKSPRFIRPEQAAGIAEKVPRQVARVGVFANPSVAEIEAVLAEVPLDVLQLHGRHDFDLIDHFRQKTKIVCAFNISPDFDFAAFERYRETIDAFLLDGYKKGAYGGTGKVIDWQKAQAAKKYGPVILAGGLNPQNIAQAVRISAPDAVDLNSGIEDRPGVKNHQKLRDIFSQLKDRRRDWQPAEKSTFPEA